MDPFDDIAIQLGPLECETRSNNNYADERSSLLRSKSKRQNSREGRMMVPSRYTMRTNDRDSWMISNLSHSYLPAHDEDGTESEDEGAMNNNQQYPQVGIRSSQRNNKRSLRRRLFLLLTEPESSILSAIFFVILVILISASVFIMVIQTLPNFQYTPEDCTYCGGEEWLTDDDGNITFDDDSVLCICPPTPLPWTIKCQKILMYIFTVEWILRAICFEPPAAERLNGWGALRQWLSFLTEWGQIIDALAVFPYYLERLNNTNRFLPLRLLRFTRVFRILRLGQYNDTFNSLVNVLYESTSSLNLLVIVIAFGAMLFGSLMYFVEKGKWVYTDLTDPPSFQFVREGLNGPEISPFSSIPDCFWWFIVTATTVGYGDTYPTSAQGKSIAAVAMLIGILVVAFPVSIFSDFWSLELERSGKVIEPDKDSSETESTKYQSTNDFSESSSSSIKDIISSLADHKGMIRLSKDDLGEICDHIEGINRSRRRIEIILKNCQASDDLSNIKEAGEKLAVFA